MAKKNLSASIYTSGLIITGLKHCGKSSLGMRLAQTLSLPFYDLDTLILEDISGEGYLSVRELYRTAGRSKFQEHELAAAKKLAGIMENTAAVAALGGGTIENEKALGMLPSRAPLLYLHVEEEELFRRISASGIPPFLEGDRRPEELFADIYARRTVLYERAADALLHLPAQPLEKNFSRLYTFLTASDRQKKTNGTGGCG
ncbi:MAG: shikimate kinase [Spirochaetaceae bacterium]